MHSYKKYLSDKSFVASVIIGFLFLAVSLVAQSMASNYTSTVATVSVTDIILSNIRTYDVSLVFVYGAVLCFLLIVFECEKFPKYIPFILKSTALFTVIRAFFISLTHIGEFPTHTIINPAFSWLHLNGIFTGVDGALFFSGHTGLPFLMALIFWNHKKLRAIFLGFSVLFGIAVLLGHLHYSIDVFAAFFMAYGIFHIAKFIFKKDWQRSRS